MDWRQQAYLKHQQQRWLRPDAARWVRPDAAEFLKPGTRATDVYPALERKYSDDQPRVPGGESGGGQWTSGGGGSSSGRPRVHIYRSDPESDDVGDGGSSLSLPDLSFDLGSLLRDIDWSDLFDIKPRAGRTGGVRLAGDAPRGMGDNGGPPLDPPDIPERRPSTREGRMSFVRSAAVWIGRVGRQTPMVSAFLGVLDQVDELKRLTDMIKTANDPPATLEELRARATRDSEGGYNDRHIVNQHDGNMQKFGSERIDSRENVVRVPTLKHIEITRWYSTKNKDYGFRPPQELLRGESFEEQMRIGLGVLKDFKVIK